MKLIFNKKTIFIIIVSYCFVFNIAIADDDLNFEGKSFILEIKASSKEKISLIYCLRDMKFKNKFINFRHSDIYKHKSLFITLTAKNSALLHIEMLNGEDLSISAVLGKTSTACGVMVDMSQNRWSYLLETAWGDPKFYDTYPLTLKILGSTSLSTYVQED